MNNMHGLSQTIEYKTWHGMIERCENTKTAAYKRYGGKGIKVCERWRNSVAAFISDMGARPSKKHTIDRIDNKGNYEPSNCRWADWYVQSNNRSNNRKIVYNEEEKSITEWAKYLGITVAALRYRINKGFPMEKVMRKGRHSSLTNARQNIYEFKGKKLNIKQWSIELGVTRKLIYKRIKHNIPLDLPVTRKNNQISGIAALNLI